MPIYSYGCDFCLSEFDVLSKYDDPPPFVCPGCGAANPTKLVTLPNGKVRQCLSAAELGVEFSSEEQLGKAREAKDKALPWWRNGSIDGCPKKDKPINLNQVKDLNHYVQTGEAT